MSNLTAYQVEYATIGYYKNIEFGFMFCLAENESMAEEIGYSIFKTNPLIIIQMRREGTVYDNLIVHKAKGFLLIDKNRCLLFEPYLTRAEKINKLFDISE